MSMLDSYRIIPATNPFFYGIPGHDSNDGFSTTTAKRTLMLNHGRNAVIGTGIYDYNYAVVTGTLNQYLEGDGKVIIRRATFGRHSTANRRLANLQLEDCRFSNGVLSTRTNSMRNMVLVDSELSFSAAPSDNYTNCLVVGAKQNVVAPSNSPFGSTALLNCTFISGYVPLYPSANYTGQQWNYCYFGPLVNLVADFTVSQANRIQNSCIQCPIKINGVVYELKRKKDGSLYEGATAALPDIAQVIPDFYSLGNFNENPGFMPGTYVPAMGSPLLLGASKYIGYMSPTMRIYANQLRAEEYCWYDNNLELTQEGYLQLKAGATEGEFNFIKKVSDSPTKIGRIEPLWTPTFRVDNIDDSSLTSNVLDNQFEGYPRLATISSTVDASTVTLSAPASVGEYLYCLGEFRQITAVNGNTITLGTALRAAPPATTKVRVGSEEQMAAINHNYLAYLGRVSNLDRITITPNGSAYTLVDNEWDNDGAVAGQLYKCRYYEDMQFIEGAVSKPVVRGKWVHIKGKIVSNYRF